MISSAGAKIKASIGHFRHAGSMSTQGGRTALEGLYVPAHPPWYPAFRGELLSFPAGKHDDQVDALGLIGQLLDLMVPQRVTKPKDPDRPDA
jgi:phage terminase large subunit-like protein